MASCDSASFFHGAELDNFFDGGEILGRHAHDERTNTFESRGKRLAQAGWLSSGLDSHVQHLLQWMLAVKQTKHTRGMRLQACKCAMHNCMHLLRIFTRVQAHVALTLCPISWLEGSESYMT